MSSEQGNQEYFKISIRNVTAGVEVELNEVINLRGYQKGGNKVRTKRRATTWNIHPELTIEEIMKLCIEESVFNDDYGKRI